MHRLGELCARPSDRAVDGGDKRSRRPMAKSHKATSSPVSDGHPSDTVHYREYKLILRPDRFTSPEGLHAFCKLVRSAAKQEGVEVAHPAPGAENLLREIVFYDTPAFDLYEQAFILRQRAQHRD